MLPPNNRKGSGYTNINRVVTANQGNKLGQTVSSGVQNQATQVKNQTQQATTNFNQEAQKNRLDTDEAANKRDQTIGRFSSPNETTEQNVSDDEVKDFTRYRTGTYEGPKELNDYQTIAGRAQNTEQLGDLSRSTGGRQELLKRFVGGSGYTQGQQNLDNLLLGQSGNALNDVRRSTQGLTQDVTGANTQAANLAQEYANRAKIFGDETVQKIGTAKTPISTKIDDILKANQGNEDTRKNNLKYIQDALSGAGNDYKSLNRITRLGLGLQSAKDAGYLTDAQANSLLGEGGLIQRSEQLGLDTNALLNERMKDIMAQNLNRGGAASNIQESQLNSLDRLLGKQGSDLEFNQNPDYVKGDIGWDLDSLNDYLTKMEQNKYGADLGDDVKAGQQRYLDLAKAGFGQTFGGGVQAAGGALNQVLDPIGSITNPLQTLENGQNIVGGSANAGLGQQQMYSQGPNALLEGLTKLNIGGNSLANTEGGKQLLKAIELKSKLEQEAAKNGQVLVDSGIGSITGGVKDLTQGNIASAVQNLSGLNLAKDLSSSLASSISSQLSKIVNTPKISAPKVKICFAGDTNVLMADNTWKNIKELKLGDEMKLGGRVICRGEAFTDEMYNYNGVNVSGAHAVFENGVWVRVQDSKLSISYNEETVVYPVINEGHIMVTAGQIWADMIEVNDYEDRTKHDILEQLNNDKERNLSLLGIMDEIKEIKQS